MLGGASAHQVEGACPKLPASVAACTSKWTMHFLVRGRGSTAHAFYHLPPGKNHHQLSKCVQQCVKEMCAEQWWGPINKPLLFIIHSIFIPFALAYRWATSDPARGGGCTHNLSPATITISTSDTCISSWPKSFQQPPPLALRMPRPPLPTFISHVSVLMYVWDFTHCWFWTLQSWSRTS